MNDELYYFGSTLNLDGADPNKFIESTPSVIYGTDENGNQTELTLGENLQILDSQLNVVGVIGGVIDDNNVSTGTTYSSNKIVESLEEKQNNLIAGDNIIISGNTISSTGIGSGATIDDTKITTKTAWSSDKINSELSGKQDIISDLSEIRSGAALGATALQSFTETDPTVPAWAKQSSKPTYTAEEVGALPNDTVIPSKTSDLTNDSGFITGYTAGDNIEISGSVVSALGFVYNKEHNSIAIGEDTVASGWESHAEGSDTKAEGQSSHAEGEGSRSIGQGSHAEGLTTKAFGDSSHAEGEMTEAIGEGSHAEGIDSIASGITSHAEGADTLAIGNYSHAEGHRTITNNSNEHAEGKWNISNTGLTDDLKTLHSIGIGGEYDEEKEEYIRKNAFEVMQNGDMYVNGIGEYDGTNPESSNTLQEVINNIDVKSLTPEEIDDILTL